ncbi:MAG: RNA polymerase sigma factor [Clostridia bacterium]|nr:RNA polymerase sigma factor [Clostridia bacterium]
MTRKELEKLLEEYGRSLSAFCYTVGKSENTADEIFQEVCLKLLKKDLSLKDEKAVTSYLYKTVLNVYRDILRKTSKRGEVSVEDEAVNRYIMSIPDSKAEREDFTALYRAIANLPVKYREIINLVYFNGVSEKDAAGIAGIPEGTVKSRLHKAKELLKKELQK